MLHFTKLQGGHAAVYCPHTGLHFITLMGTFSHLQKKKAQHGVTHQLHHVKGCLKTCASV